MASGLTAFRLELYNTGSPACRLILKIFHNGMSQLFIKMDTQCTRAHTHACTCMHTRTHLLALFLWRNLIQPWTVFTSSLTSPNKRYSFCIWAFMFPFPGMFLFTPFTTTFSFKSRLIFPLFSHILWKIASFHPLPMLFYFSLWFCSKYLSSIMILIICIHTPFIRIGTVCGLFTVSLGPRAQPTIAYIFNQCCKMNSPEFTNSHFLVWVFCLLYQKMPVWAKGFWWLTTKVSPQGDASSPVPQSSPLPSLCCSYSLELSPKWRLGLTKCYVLLVNWVFTLVIQVNN